jgi:hypothetical protein
MRETVETVGGVFGAAHTPLKQGVNETGSGLGLWEGRELFILVPVLFGASLTPLKRGVNETESEWESWQE